MSNQLRIESTTAAIEWEFDGTTRSLVTPDPTNSTIQFTLRLDSIQTHGQRGSLFEIMVPIRFKDKGEAASIFLRISPLIITSFSFTTKTEPSDFIKTTFNTAVTCLDFQLNKNIAVLAPTYVQMPITAARQRSGVVLDALRELSRVHWMRIYIRYGSITVDQLSLIKEGISQRTLEPLSGPNYDVSRMFGGAGAKPVDLALPPPPSYETSAAAPPPPTPLYERKRPRHDSDGDGDGGSRQLWTKLRQLESIIMAKVEKPRAEAENVELVAELKTENVHLQKRVACLEDRLSALENKCETLEREMATLEQAYRDRDDEEDTQLLSMREDIESLQSRTDWIERGKDDEAFAAKIRGDIFDELAARVAGG